MYINPIEWQPSRCAVREPAFGLLQTGLSLACGAGAWIHKQGCLSLRQPEGGTQHWGVRAMRRDVSARAAKGARATKPSFAICCNNANSGQRLAEGARQVMGAAMVTAPQAGLEFRSRFLRTRRFSISKIAGVFANSPQKQAQAANIGTPPSIFSEFRAETMRKGEVEQNELRPMAVTEVEQAASPWPAVQLPRSEPATNVKLQPASGWHLKLNGKPLVCVAASVRLQPASGWHLPRTAQGQRCSRVCLFQQGGLRMWNDACGGSMLLAFWNTL
jgi:hypothetical protein